MVMRRVVASYFGIVKNTMKDLVPKVIMRFVVSHTADMIHGHLIAKILRRALLSSTACVPCMSLAKMKCNALISLCGVASTVAQARSKHKSVWLMCSGDEKDVMRERADVADRRAELSVTCDVLSRALAQLQQIPRELETSGAMNAWGNGATPLALVGDHMGSPGMPIVRRSTMDMYTGRPR